MNRTTEMSKTSIIRQFLSLPDESLPSAEYVGESGPLHPWSAIRSAIGGDSEKREMSLGCGDIVLRADRDEWRDGIIVSL